MKVHAAIAKALIDNGIDTLFGLVGDANLFLVDSFVREYGGKFVSAAHEAGATLMALGYSAVAGKIGVVTVTRGPALVNTLTPMVEGVKGSLPIVLLCGDTAIEDRDNLQKVPQRELIVATGAGFEQLRSPNTLSEDIATALRRAEVERRPIALNMPSDFQWADVEYRPLAHQLFDNRALVPAGNEIDNAIGIIAAAKRPFVLAGRGAMHHQAKDSIVRLAERIDALLATTLKAKGLFSCQDFNVGIFGTLSTSLATDLIMRSDCIIAFGAGLNRYTTAEGSFLSGKRLVQVNLEQGEVGKNVTPDAGVIGDPGLVADLFVKWLDEAEISPSGFRNEEVRVRIKSFSPKDGLPDLGTANTVDLSRAFIRLNDAVPNDRVLVTDGGRFVTEAWRLFDVSKARSLVYTLHFASIGMGLSEAIGAAFAAPKRPILLVTGDGGFMLGGLAEFNSAVRHKVDLIAVVCSDGSYGMEHIQFRERQMDPGVTLFDWPDFAPVAELLGGRGITVRSLADLEKAADFIKHRDRPILIDLKLDPDRIPPMSR